MDLARHTDLHHKVKMNSSSWGELEHFWLQQTCSFTGSHTRELTLQSFLIWLWWDGSWTGHVAALLWWQTMRETRILPVGYVLEASWLLKCSAQLCCWLHTGSDCTFSSNWQVYLIEKFCNCTIDLPFSDIRHDYYMWYRQELLRKSFHTFLFRVRVKISLFSQFVRLLNFLCLFPTFPLQNLSQLRALITLLVCVWDN